MIFLPIVERELRVASRRRGTYWGRAVAATSAIVIFLGTLWFDGLVAPKDLGKHVFDVLSGLFLLNSLAAGIRYTADCLSEEKREGTLGLLFLTDLRGHDVVFGKLAATSMDALYGLIAIFPVLAIPLLLGGVTFGEFWRMTLVLANTLFFSLAAGIFVSALSRDARRAMAWTLIVILLINGVLPGVGFWLALTRVAPIQEAFLLPSVWHAWWLAFETQYSVNPAPFMWSVLFTHGLAWFFLAMASFAARRSWQDRPAGARVARWRQCWQRWSYGTAAQRAAFRTRLLDISPCFWLGGRHRLKPGLVWAFLGLSGCLWLWGALKWREDWLQAGTYFSTAFLLHGALKLWVTSEACLRFGPDHRSGALELLLSTPLTAAEILRGQMLALRRQFMWPILMVIGVDFAFMLAGAAHPGSGGDDAWVWICWAGIVTLVADVYTLCWVGMWIGLTARRANRATGATVARVLVLPCGACFGLIFLMSLTGLWHRVEDTWTFYLGVWVAVGMIVDLHFGIRARLRLLQDLRTVATQRFVPRRSWFASLKPRRDPSGPALPTAIVSEM